jgi:hypothetical protein
VDGIYASERFCEAAGQFFLAAGELREIRGQAGIAG